MVPTSVPASRLYPADPPTSLRPYVVLAIVIPRHRHHLPCLDHPPPPFPVGIFKPETFLDFSPRETRPPFYRQSRTKFRFRRQPPRCLNFALYTPQRILDLRVAFHLSACSHFYRRSFVSYDATEFRNIFQFPSVWKNAALHSHLEGPLLTSCSLVHLAVASLRFNWNSFRVSFSSRRTAVFRATYCGALDVIDIRDQYEKQFQINDKFTAPTNDVCRKQARYCS